MQRFPDIEKVRQALIDCPASPLDIFSETKLTPGWQQSVKSRRVIHPSYPKTVDLINYIEQNYPSLLIEA